MRRKVNKLPPGSVAPPPSALPVLRENENVGGSRHDCDMSTPRITGADTRPALGPWFLTGAPLAHVSPRADLR
jgi:hypothetical protein